MSLSPQTAPNAPSGPGPAPGRRLLPWVLAGLAVAHLAWSLLAVVPGHLSIDEGTYHFMVHSLERGRPLEIENGYRELPSPELRAGMFRERDGRLVSQYPELFTFLALPFYAAWGYRGLFLLNALAFLGIVALTWDLGRRLFDSHVASVAALVLGLSTFLWDYSQAAWPHASTTLLVLAAFWCAVRGLQPGSVWGWPLAAGLIAGLAPGVRLDAAFAWPAILLPALFAWPPRWKRAAVTALALLPGLALMSFLNAEKFGVWSPFHYGARGNGATSGPSPYLPLVAAGAVALAVLWGLSRRRLAQRLAGRPVWVVAGLAAIALLALALPATREVLRRVCEGAAQLVVDLRFRDLSIQEPALHRTPDGALVYLGALKKSLLQSCPWLPLALLPAFALRTGRRWTAWLLLLPLPLGYLGAYSFFAWHGGLSLNLRYLLPALPCLALLGAAGWCELTASLPRPWVAAGAGALAAGIASRLLLPRMWGTPPEQEGPLLDLPLALAAALAVGLVALLLLGRRRSGVLRHTVAALAGAAFAWAALVTFVYDAPRARAHRAENLAVSERVAPWLEPDSLLIVPYPDPFFSLMEIEGVSIAVPGRDGFADFRRLVGHALDAGRPVYAALPRPMWSRLGEAGLLDGLLLRPAGPGAPILRILPAPRANAPASAAATPRATP